jgi:hypothetical protein
MEAAIVPFEWIIKFLVIKVMWLKFSCRMIKLTFFHRTSFVYPSIFRRSSSLVHCLLTPSCLVRLTGRAFFFVVLTYLMEFGSSRTVKASLDFLAG